MINPVSIPSASEIIACHDALLARDGWPAVPPPPRDQALWLWLQANHRNNSLLWAEEDLARRTTVADAEIAANKRAIDRYNQARNDATERVDELLLTALGLLDEAPARAAAAEAPLRGAARLNSETAGSMIDRLSIMALKIKAMREQTQRTDVAEDHRAAAGLKLARLQQQRTDLAGCLDALLAETAAGKAYFKVYRQFKMYNDAQLNPQLVKERQQP
jgi:hypothetical protein